MRIPRRAVAHGDHVIRDSFHVCAQIGGSVNMISKLEIKNERATNCYSAAASHLSLFSRRFYHIPHHWASAFRYSAVCAKQIKHRQPKFIIFIETSCLAVWHASEFQIDSTNKWQQTENSKRKLKVVAWPVDPSFAHWMPESRNRRVVDLKLNPSRPPFQLVWRFNSN